MSAGWTWIYGEAPGTLLPWVAVLAVRETGEVERLIRAATPKQRDAAVAAADDERLADSVHAWLALQEAA